MSHGQLPESGNAEEQSKRRWSLFEKVLSVIGALLVLSTAILGLITAKVNAAKDRAEENASGSQASAITLQSRVDELEQANSELLPSLQNTPSSEQGPTIAPTETEASGTVRAC
jgi:hypothetical protein